MQLPDAWRGCGSFLLPWHPLSKKDSLTNRTHSSNSASHASTASSRPTRSAWGPSTHPLLHFGSCHESTYLPRLALSSSCFVAVSHSLPGALHHLARSRQRNDKANWRDLSDGILCNAANAGTSMSFTEACKAHAGHGIIKVSVMPRRLRSLINRSQRPARMHKTSEKDLTETV